MSSEEAGEIVMRRLLPLVLLLPLAACASKGDVKEMESAMVAELRTLGARQDSLSRQIRELRSVLVDSLGSRESQAFTERGEMRRRFQSLEDQLARVEALAGENQRILSQLRERGPREGGSGEPADEEASAGRAGPEAGVEPAGGGAGTDTAAAASDARRLYEAALQQYRREAYGTARSGLQEFLARFPDHELAPDAQFYVAETLAEAGEAERALDAYARVLERFPNSRRAPSALYKSGRIELERGNVEDARSYFSRVVRGYPDSDEARLARDRLEELQR